MAEQKKTAGEILQEELVLTPKNGGIQLTDKEIEEANAFCEGYKKFLDAGKTECESVDYTLELLKKNGYEEYEAGKKYKAGDKIYINNRGRALLIAAIGSRPLTDGTSMIASHIDVPRLDLKPRPLYEEAQLAMLKTHYYGGVRKYQWVTVPLALHGVVIKGDGSTLQICIGEDDSDPVFCIGDLLPHLAKDQNKRTLAEGIKGEEMNVLFGALPFRDEKVQEKVKLAVLKLLKEKYDMTEADFLSADLSLVPAHKARDVGLDRSMLGAYGHDDRVCAYTSLIASLETPTPEYTWVNILADKEETGSDGNTGLSSRFLEYFIMELAEAQGVSGIEVLAKSKCLSADVNAAFDPTFPEVHEKKNAAYLNYGVTVTKYTGSGGKYSTNEASAEFMGEVRRLFDSKNILWQTGNLGKVDQGGGGTVAKFISKLGVDVIDVGVPVLSMHAPFEVVGKIDVYSTFKAFDAFLKR